MQSQKTMIAGSSWQSATTTSVALHGNLEGIGRPVLYHRAKSGTKHLIESYNALVDESLQVLAAVDHRVISRRKKIDFFRRAAHCYGRSALMLSGGAGLIYFHHGVVQSLQGMDELLVAAERMSEKLGTRYFSPALLMADALLDQKYTGDINLILEKEDYRWRDILFVYANDEDDRAIESLKMAGIRSTWPKLPMIRNATQVARTIDQILLDIDGEKIDGQSSSGRHPITAAV